jgi:hypothetical protein
MPSLAKITPASQENSPQNQIAIALIAALLSVQSRSLATLPAKKSSSAI